VDAGAAETKAGEWSVKRMRMGRGMAVRGGVWLMAAAMVLGAAGCTVNPETTQQTLATTTSAEQVQRIFWKDVVDGKWDEVRSVLAANVVWMTAGKELGRDEVMEYLKGLKAKQAQVGETMVKANGPDITVTYTLQVVRADGTTETRRMAAVWQKLEGKKVMTPYLLTLQCDANAAAMK
jgi:hypothetical protein